MGDSQFVFIFSKPGPDYVRFVVLDGLLSAARAISTIPELTSEQISELDALFDAAEREQSNLFVYAYLHGIDLPPEAAAVVFRMLLQEWSRDGRDNWVAAASYYELLPEATDAAAGPARTLSTVVRAVETLVPLATDDRWIEEAAGKAHGAFLDLAGLLSQAGYDQHALACVPGRLPALSKSLFPLPVRSSP